MLFETNLKIIKGMKQIVFTALLLLITVAMNAQISHGGTPPSFNIDKSNEIDRVSIMPPDMNLLMLEDAENIKNGTLRKIATLLSVNLNTHNAGTWTTLENGTEIWQLSITSEGARALALHFDNFNIPLGSKFFVYDPSHTQLLGSYTYDNNRGDIEFTIGILLGDEMILEYVSPSPYEKEDGYHKRGLNEITQPEFQIARISYIYRGVEGMEARMKDTGYGTSDNTCEVNVNCSEGNNWQDEKRGVARIYCVDGWSAGWCTGTLVNNENEDGTPYFLTADHCGGEASTSDFNQWVFYFNYEAPTCTYNTQTNPEPSSNSISGCSKVSRAPLDGGSDFLLVELNNTPPSNYDVVYNGWRNNNYAGGSGVGIHHPSGDIKKISTFTSTPGTSTYNGETETGASNAHWRVYWSETDHGHGVTEPGSSGSPLFDSNGFVVGTLSGGSSYCDATSSPDLYGKFYYHWTLNGSSNSEQLSPWLGSSLGQIDMYDPNNSGLTADFYGSPTSLAPGGQVHFTNQCSGSPSTYSWTFAGGTPSSSAAANPTITYNSVGTYTVSLTISGGGDSDTENKTGYIHVAEGATGFSLDFEDASDFQVDNFSPWTTYDGDGQTTYGIQDIDFTNQNYTGSFIAFNHASTSPVAGDNWIAHGGNRCGICFAATTPSNNDWLISPQMSLEDNSEFTFWAKSNTDQYGLERFKVLVSTSGNSVGNFSAISSGDYVEAPTEWTQYTYDLSAYDNDDVYVAVQCISNDAFGFMIDDINLTTETGSTETAPIADFYGTPTNITEGGQVSFHDQSSNTPTGWYWTFQGGSPATSTSQTPTVTYNTAGTYNVILTASNGGGSNTKTRNAYIVVTTNSSGADFSLDFEDASDFQLDDFDPWTTYDGDGQTTYGIQDIDFTNQNYTGSFIAFNHASTTPAAGENWEAHGGDRCGICFAATTPSNNDWLISPQVSLEDDSEFIFWAKSATDQYGLERFKVLVSTSGNSVGNFSAISSGDYVEAPIEWTQYTYDLSAYDNDDVYVAIQCVSNDAFAFMIDDIEILTEGNSTIGESHNNPNNISIFPNPTSSIIYIDLGNLDIEKAQIRLMNVSGQIIDVKAETHNNLISLDMSNLSEGLYFIEVSSKKGKSIHKISIKK